MTFKLVNVVVPLVLIPGTFKFVNPDPLPTNEVAVTIPVRLTLPVPVMSLLLTSKLPPNCGVVSSTTFLRNVLANLSSAIEPANCALVIVPVRSVVGRFPLNVVAVSVFDDGLYLNPPSTSICLLPAPLATKVTNCDASELLAVISTVEAPGAPPPPPGKLVRLDPSP